ncbi:HTH domain-containing protein [Capsulimonas corticalis]|uniref:HTH domain-containing protein n=1 Tax=Capsulimonas corticalis TaxID=2219043 RepID=UPI000F65284E|nr:HTH domain-containing protein [Capsulimonas corticalis]
MKVLDAVEQVLGEAGEPLHIFEIHRRVVAAKLWDSPGKTPDQTLHARIAVDIKKNPQTSRFQRTGRGIFALRKWGLPEYSHESARTETAQTVAPVLYLADVAKTPQKRRSTRRKPIVEDSIFGDEDLDETSAAPPSPFLAFTDAAERVLEQSPGKTAMHYQTITAEARRLGLINTQDQTPEATMYAQILTEIDRQHLQGEPPRFSKHGRGMVGLSSWEGAGLQSQITEHNFLVSQQLQTRLDEMPRPDFENLIAALLVEMGFENVALDKRLSEEHLDLRGTLVIAGSVRIGMLVRVVRDKVDLSAAIVQSLRGSLGTHEQGLVITTGGFSAAATQEAQRPNAVPVGLLEGERLVSLLMQYEVGVRQIPCTLYELKA